MKIYRTLISAEELARHSGDPAWAIVDCRFSLQDRDYGRKEYEEAHIPGAVYAHLDDDLSGEIQPGTTGRHPLPTVEKAVEIFSKLGIDRDIQVVAYDDDGGALGAARLWWLLRWCGHEAAAVLDGDGRPGARITGRSVRASKRASGGILSQRLSLIWRQTLRI